MRAALRRGVLGALVATLVGGALVGRVVAESRAELVVSDAAFDQGELRASVVHARRAATLAPRLLPEQKRARARLLAIAVGAEAKGEHDVARLAWRSIRGVILETRTIGLLDQAELEVANDALARLAVVDAAPERAAPMKARFAELLARDDAPRSEWGALLALGVVLAMTGLGWVAARGLTADGRWVARPLALGLAGTVAGTLLWTIALWQA